MAKALKRFVRNHLPAWLVNKMRAKRSAGRSADDVFTRKFHKHTARDMASLSGPGSDLAQTDAIRRALPPLMKRLGVRTLLDVPCGDFYWMQFVAADVAYIGGDIVGELIERNRRAFGNALRRFVVLDVRADPLPGADLLLCRDCLVHLPNADVRRALRNIARSACTYLLTTTFVDRDSNDDVAVGKWRPLNLEKPPFRLPPPIELIDEAHPDAAYRDKRLALWRIAELPRFDED